MYTGIYKMAGHVFQIDSIHADIHEMSRSYSCSQMPEFVVATTASHIEYERMESARTRAIDLAAHKALGNVADPMSTGLATKENADISVADPVEIGSAAKENTDDNVADPVEIGSAAKEKNKEQAACPAPWETDGYLETLAVYRLLCKRMLDFGVLLLHGSCLSVDGNGILFVARSGTGKSTHTRNWRKVFGSRVVMVNDDKPLVDVNSMRIFGTPWDGKHHISTNTSVPLRAVVVLTRGTQNSIEPMQKGDALNWMMKQTYMPPDAMLKIRTLALLDVLMEKLDFYLLKCNKDEESASVAYNGIWG